MVVWSVWRAIGESDGSDHLKYSTNLGGLRWLRKVIVYSHVDIDDFGEGVTLANQWDHKQSAYNARIWVDSIVGVEGSIS
jgi:hypothetical protein